MPEPSSPDARSQERELATSAELRASFPAEFERVAPALYTWARLRIRPQLRAHLDADDLLQEVWARAYARLDHYDPAQGKLRAWLFGIARNALLESLRRLALAPRRESSTSGTTHGFRLDQRAESVTSITKRLARDEAIERLLARVEALPTDERRLFVWCGLEERTCAEAATRLGVSEEAATKRWQRLRARLKGELGER